MNSITQPLPVFDGLSDVEPMWDAHKRIEKARQYTRLRQQIGFDVSQMLDQMAIIDGILERERKLLFKPQPRRKQPPLTLLSTNSGYTTEPDSQTALHLRGVMEVDRADAI